MFKKAMSSRQRHNSDAESVFRTPSKQCRVLSRREASPVETMDEDRDENQSPFGHSFVESRIANTNYAQAQHVVHEVSEREECEGWEDDDDKPAEITSTRRSRRVPSRRNARKNAGSVPSITVLGFPSNPIDPFETPTRENDNNAVFASESEIRLR